jgi:N-succinyldiaminopimelate aminotransferase
VAGLGTTIFTDMSALALRTGAINLGQGFPDTDGPPAVIQAAVDALWGGENQYAPLPGVPALRDAVFEHQRSWYGLDPEDVLITFGATEAIASALLGLCDPGDEVVVLEPYYDSYAACIAFAGATRRPVTLRRRALRYPRKRCSRRSPRALGCCFSTRPTTRPAAC